MRKLIAILVSVLAILLAVPAALAHEADVQCKHPEDLQTQKLQAMYDFAFYRIERHRIGMEAAISEIDDKADVSGLSDIKNSFVAKGEELKAAANAGDRAKYETAEKDIKQLAKDFRELARNKSTDNAAVLTSVDTTLFIKEAYLDGLLQTAYDDAVKYEEAKFDSHTCRAQAILDKLAAKGIDVSKAQAKLDEIKAKRSGFASALGLAKSSCADTPLFKCTSSDKKRYGELRDDVKKEFRDLREQAKTEIMEHREAAKNASAARGGTA